MVKKRMTVSVREKDVKWLDKMIDLEIFASYSHAYRMLIQYYKRIQRLKAQGKIDLRGKEWKI